MNFSIKTNRSNDFVSDHFSFNRWTRQLIIIERCVIEKCKLKMKTIETLNNFVSNVRWSNWLSTVLYIYKKKKKNSHYCCDFYDEQRTKLFIHYASRELTQSDLIKAFEFIHFNWSAFKIDFTKKVILFLQYDKRNNALGTMYLIQNYVVQIAIIVRYC